MSEILTESFCERCGTRYTFEPARPKTRLTRAKVLSLGLKNFVLSDETSLDEAMAAARSEADRERTAHQLDAFHKTFNFCMSCRQYTCPNCWNDTEERCLSCAPQLGREPIPGAFPTMATFTGMTAISEAPPNRANGHLEDDAEAEPGLFESERVAVEPITDYLAAAPEVVEVEAVVVAEPAVTDPAIVGPVEKAIGQTADLMRRFRPGESLDDELAAYELERTEAEALEAAVEPELAVVEADEAVEPVAVQPVVAAPLVAEPGPEPVVAGPVVVEPEPVAAEPEPVVAAQPEPEPPPTARAADVVEQPTWQITAPDTSPPTIAPATGPDVARPVTPGPASPETPETHWPSKPEWPAVQASADALLPFPSRLTRPEGGIEALWAASNQELIATPPLPGRSNSGIQPCVSCGLSLSATARFCRRCGTLQVG